MTGIAGRKVVEFQTVLFYALSGGMVVSGLGVVTIRNPIYAALLLVAAFIFAAGLWMLLEAEFLAIALVLVYVGAVMVLFLFVIMMLDINLEILREGFWRYFPLGAIVGALLLYFMISALVVGGEVLDTGAFQDKRPAPADYSNTKALGRLIYTDYIYPFQLAAVVLLIAIISAIVITLRRRPGSRNVDPAWQVRVTAKDRLRILSMPPLGQGDGYKTKVATNETKQEGGAENGNR